VIDPAIAASTALDKGDFATALTLAEQALAKDPKNSTALDVAARAVCSTGDVKQTDKAKQYLAKLDPQDRVVAGQVCKDHGIKFAKPTAPPKPGPIAEADIMKESANAKGFLRSQNFPAAEALALRILETEPGNGAALRVLGISACRLKHEANVERALFAVYKRGPIAREIRAACNRTEE
jgi:Flp pilus assembly protein TadD